MTPSKVVGDLQIGAKKVTLNHLDEELLHICLVNCWCFFCGFDPMVNHH